MDLDINSFNVEISIFLRHLMYYGSKKHFQINDKTMELLIKTIDALVANAKLTDACQQNSVDFLFELDDSQYELRQFIMCRSCYEQIPVNKDDYENHQFKPSHILRAQQEQQKPKNLTQITSKIEGGSETTSGIDSITTDDESYEIDRILNDELTETMQFANIKDDDEIINLDSSSVHVIEVRGLPWIVTKREILGFFHDINIVNGVNGIHFMIDKVKNQCNQAYIQVQSEKDLNRALAYNCTKMGVVVIRVKAVMDITKFRDLISNKDYPQNQNVIRLENLPVTSDEETIRNLFPDLGIDRIMFPRCEPEQDTVEAFIAILDGNDVEKLLKLNNKKVQNNIIRIFRSTEEQLEYRCMSAEAFFTKIPDSVSERKSNADEKTDEMNVEWVKVNSVGELIPSTETIPTYNETIKTTEHVSSDDIPEDIIIDVSKNTISKARSLSIDNRNHKNSTENPIYVAQANGFPWAMTKVEIMQFLNGVNFIGLHFIIDNRINKCNKLYIQLASENDYKRALCFNNKKLNGLNIEIIPVKVIEKFHKLTENPSYPTDQNVLRLAQLPMETTEEMIRTFFNQFRITEIRFAVLPADRTTREAYVMFTKHDDIERALVLDGNCICNVPVEIYRSSLAQMAFYANIPLGVRKLRKSTQPSVTQICSKDTDFGKESIQVNEGIEIIKNSTKINNSKAIDSPYVQNKFGTSYVVQVSGLPWQITKAKIISLFPKIDILNGIDGIHFIINERRDKTNQAYIQLRTEQDYKKVFEYNNTNTESLAIEVAEADLDEFSKIINSPDYPQNQNVVRLVDLPNYCNEDMITAVLHDLDIVTINLVFGQIKLLFVEAFVVFSNSRDVEKALGFSRIVIADNAIKIYRSSLKQMQFHCSSTTKPWSGMSPIMNVNSNKKLAASPASVDLKTIVARGFSWKITTAEVRKLFNNVSIVDGEQGIQIFKNGAMEAHFKVNGEDEMRKAIAHNGEKYDARTIYVYEMEMGDGFQNQNRSTSTSSPQINNKFQT